MKTKKVLVGLLSLVCVSTQVLADQNDILKSCTITTESLQPYGRVYDVANFATSGGYVQAYDKTGGRNQRFTMVFAGNHTQGTKWYVTADHSGLCIVAPNNGNGDTLTQELCNANSYVLVQSITDGSGAYWMNNNYTPFRYWSIGYASVQNGAHITIWDYNGQPNQRVRINGCINLLGALVHPRG